MRWDAGCNAQQAHGKRRLRKAVSRPLLSCRNPTPTWDRTGIVVQARSVGCDDDSIYSSSHLVVNYPRIVSGWNKPGYKWDKWGQCPLITGVITHLLSGMNQQVALPNNLWRPVETSDRSNKRPHCKSLWNLLQGLEKTCECKFSPSSLEAPLPRPIRTLSSTWWKSRQTTGFWSLQTGMVYGIGFFTCTINRFRYSDPVIIFIKPYPISSILGWFMTLSLQQCIVVGWYIYYLQSNIYMYIYIHIP